MARIERLCCPLCNGERSFDNDKLLCYNMINVKAKIEESTNTVVDSSPGRRTDGDESAHSVQMDLSGRSAYISRPGPSPPCQRGRPDQVFSQILRALI